MSAAVHQDGKEVIVKKKKVCVIKKNIYVRMEVLVLVMLLNTLATVHGVIMEMIAVKVNFTKIHPHSETYGITL